MPRGADKPRRLARSSTGEPQRALLLTAPCCLCCANPPQAAFCSPAQVWAARPRFWGLYAVSKAGIEKSSPKPSPMSWKQRPSGSSSLNPGATRTPCLAAYPAEDPPPSSAESIAPIYSYLLSDACALRSTAEHPTLNTKPQTESAPAPDLTGAPNDLAHPRSSCWRAPRIYPLGVVGDHLYRWDISLVTAACSSAALAACSIMPDKSSTHGPNLPKQVHTLCESCALLLTSWVQVLISSNALCDIPWIARITSVICTVNWDVRRAKGAHFIGHHCKPALLTPHGPPQWRH